MRTRKILNVNDDETRRYLIGHALVRAGFDVIDAATGRDALKRAEADEPDVILLDVRLPDIDGFAVCRHLKRGPATSAIPIVMVSEVFTDDVDRVEALELGADGYLTDPRPAVTVATIRALLRARDAEEARRQTEIRYRTLFDSIPVPAWVVDLDTNRVIAVNDAAVRELGYSRDEFLTMAIDDFRPPDKDQGDVDGMAGARRAIESSGIWHYARKDGRLIEADVTTRRLQYEGRDVRLVIARDVTEQRRTETLQRIQLGVARLLTECASVAEAGPRVLAIIGDGLGWDSGELWEASADAFRLEARWQRRDAPELGRSHLRRTAAIPLSAGERSAGAMTFFSEDPKPPEPSTVDILTALGARIALFIERQRAEERLRVAETRYRLALKAIHGAVWDWDIQQNRVTVSEAFQTMFGYPPEAAHRTWWEEHLHPDERERVAESLEAAITSGAEVWAEEYRFRRADGSYAHVADRASVVRDGSGTALRMIGAVTDVTEQRLREERDRLRALSLGILQARETEARRIARELHDEASQLLGSAHLGLDELAQQLPVELQARIGLVRARLDEAEGRVRQLAHELRPPVLDDLGLVAAVEVLAETMAFRSGLQVDVIATVEGRLPSVMETALYRVVQEALTNAGRHAGAQSVVVTVERHDETIQCVIRDDGAGFDVERTLATSSARGLGVISMRERVEALAGRLDIVSALGQGTEIRVELPLGAGDGPAHPPR